MTTDEAREYEAAATAEYVDLYGEENARALAAVDAAVVALTAAGWTLTDADRDGCVTVTSPCGTDVTLDPDFE